MAKKFMNKKKTTTSVIAGLTAAVIMLGGTFAWQSISQQALNEVASTVNPGGRLHDDFNDITAEGYDVMTYDKNVYVENFTSRTNNGVQVYARVRLDEYMEIGENAGTENSKATSLVPGANLTDKDSWTTYKYEEDSDFRDYFDMTFGGKTVYMPTFNKDNDSLEADINGTFKSNFTDYTKYDENATKEAEATYSETDGDGNKVTKTETHTAVSTLEGTVMSMADYLEAVRTGMLNGEAFDGKGNFWVYDTDGWAYWANPVDPDTATGLLLDGINRTEQIINDDWYYAINVVAQFVTYDDLGDDNGTGFYDTTAGTVPSADALNLLNKIGVKVNHKVATAEELETALENGGIITLTEDIAIESQLTISENTVLNLGNHEITATEDLFNEEAKTWSLLSVKGATLTINDGTFTARDNDSFCVDVRDGGKVVINGGTFTGNISAVYVLEGEATIYGGEFSIVQTKTDGTYNEMLNCYDANYANGTAKITVCGGTFHNFNLTDNSEIVIPGKYNVKGTDGIYTVEKIQSENQ